MDKERVPRDKRQSSDEAMRDIQVMREIYSKTKILVIREIRVKGEIK